MSDDEFDPHKTHQFQFLSDDELAKLLEQLQRERSLSAQCLSIVKRILRSDANTEMVLSAIPGILQCSSAEFIELNPVFKQVLRRNPLITGKLLATLRSFDYDSSTKVPAYALSVKILQNIEAELLPDAISYALFVVPVASIQDLYERLKEAFSVRNDVEFYKSFESGAKPHLSRFFNCLSRNSDWSFFEFFILLISLARPSLRGKIQTLIWPAILDGRLAIETLTEFLCNSRVLNSKFGSVAKLIDIIFRSVPRALNQTSMYSMGNLCMKVIDSYPDMSHQFIDQLIANVLDGPSMAASVSIYVLLQMNEELLSSHTLYLDDVISQSGTLHQLALHAICEIIAKATPESHRSMIMVALPKRLFHHSQVLIEAGVAMSLHLMCNNMCDSSDILGWVLNAVSMNWMVIKPSILLSVVDLIWMRKDNSHMKEILEFCMSIMKNYSLITKVKEDTVLVGPTRGTYAISLTKILNEEHGELCGEIVTLLSSIFSQKKSLRRLPGGFTEGVASYLCNLLEISYVVPKEFIILSENPNAECKMKGSQVQMLLILRSFLFTVISRSEGNIDLVRFLMQLVSTIDGFLNTTHAGNKKPTFNAILSPTFVFRLLSERCFEFPYDVMLLCIAFKSLHMVFISGVYNRHFFNEPMKFLETSMDDTMPLRIMTLVNRLVSDYREHSKKNEIRITKYEIRAISDALDFVTFYATFADVNLDFEKDVMPILMLVDDVGIACRILLLGVHMHINIGALSELASQCIARHFISDLGENMPIFPFGLREMEQIAKPYQPGSNWRLMVYFSLMFCDFEQFAERFMNLVEQIADDRIEIQMTFVLEDILTERMYEFSENFEGCVRLGTHVIKLVIDANSAVLTPILKLLKTINALKMTVEHGNEELRELRQEIHVSFRRFGNITSQPRLQNLFAAVKGECDMLVADDITEPLDSPPPAEHPTNIFNVTDDSDEDFMEQSESGDEEEDSSNEDD